MFDCGASCKIHRCHPQAEKFDLTVAANGNEIWRHGKVKCIQNIGGQPIASLVFVPEETGARTDTKSRMALSSLPPHISFRSPPSSKAQHFNDVGVCQGATQCAILTLSNLLEDKALAGAN